MDLVPYLSLFMVNCLICVQSILDYHDPDNLFLETFYGICGSDLFFTFYWTQKIKETKLGRVLIRIASMSHGILVGAHVQRPDESGIRLPSATMQMG